MKNFPLNLVLMILILSSLVITLQKTDSASSDESSISVKSYVTEITLASTLTVKRTATNTVTTEVTVDITELASTSFMSKDEILIIPNIQLERGDKLIIYIKYVQIVAIKDENRNLVWFDQTRGDEEIIQGEYIIQTAGKYDIFVNPRITKRPIIDIQCAKRNYEKTELTYYTSSTVVSTVFSETIFLRETISHKSPIQVTKMVGGGEFNIENRYYTLYSLSGIIILLGIAVISFIFVLSRTKAKDLPKQTVKDFPIKTVKDLPKTKVGQKEAGRRMQKKVKKVKKYGPVKAWRCTTCRAELPWRAEYCDECGSKQQKDSRVKTPVTSARICIECGGELPFDAEYCDACGNKQK